MIPYGRPRRERWYPMTSPDCPPPITRVSVCSLPGRSVMSLPPWTGSSILQIGVFWSTIYSNLEYVKREVGMKDQLTTTSYAVLAQVAVRPWSTYELAQQRVRYFRYVWPRAESAIYREAGPNRLLDHRGRQRSATGVAGNADLPVLDGLRSHAAPLRRAPGNQRR